MPGASHGVAGPRWGAGLFAAATLGFGLMLGAAIEATLARNPFILFFGLHDWPAPLRAVPLILLLGACGVAGAALIAWRRRAGTRSARIHYRARRGGRAGDDDPADVAGG